MRDERETDEIERENARTTVLTIVSAWDFLPGFSQALGPSSTDDVHARPEPTSSTTGHIHDEATVLLTVWTQMIG